MGRKNRRTRRTRSAPAAPDPLQRAFAMQHKRRFAVVLHELQQLPRGWVWTLGFSTGQCVHQFCLAWRIFLDYTSIDGLPEQFAVEVSFYRFCHVRYFDMREYGFEHQDDLVRQPWWPSSDSDSDDGGAAMLVLSEQARRQIGDDLDGWDCPHDNTYRVLYDLLAKHTRAAD